MTKTQTKNNNNEVVSEKDVEALMDSQMTVSRAMKVLQVVCANHVGNLEAHQMIQNALTTINQALAKE